MAYSSTSKYVQLTPYLVMEYLYADQPNPETYPVNTGSTTVAYDKLINGIIKGVGSTASNNVQIFNQSQDYSITTNTSLNSVVKVSDNSYITLDPNYIVPYNDFNSNLTSTADLPVTFSSNIFLTYDSVRYHILAGYNLGNIDGLILGIDFLDVDGSYVTFSQIFLDSGFSDQYTLNPSPLMIGINSYDKYFEIKIPSLLFLNNQYISSANPSLTAAALFSKSGRGFVVGSPMRIRAYEVLNTTLTSGYPTYGANLIATLSLESEDPFTNIGAQIAPADTGDFFEFFATDNDGFIEDFILFQNSIGNAYYIQNNIEVIEQIGTAFIQTANFFTIQTTAYDIPNLYRPIIRNAGVASSFTLRYTMTLVNSADQSRVTRIASYTSTNPAKYGSFIAPLQLQTLPQVQKIYNKLATATNIGVPNSSTSPKVVVKYSNVFFERGLVNTTLTNLVVKGNTITTADGQSSQNETAFGQGKAYIFISPFDNYYKFTFYKQGTDGNTQLIDLETSGTYYMVFINNSNKKVSAPTIDNKNIANSAKGELAFKVSETLSTEILQYTNRNFYITNRPPASSDPDIVKSQIPIGSAAKDALANRSTSLNESASDIILAAKQINEGLLTNRLTVSANSSSVLYYGNWLKEGETIPSPPPPPAPATGPSPSPGTTLDPRTTQTVTDPTRLESFVDISERTPGALVPTVSFWQQFAGDGTVTDPNLNSSNTISSITGLNSFTPAPLSPNALRSAVASDVQGKISLGWSTNDIISYFLDPTQPGYKLYVGLTKEIFTQAVTGIFDDSALIILNNYGNTNSGSTNGGQAANRGSTSNQTGTDGNVDTSDGIVDFFTNDERRAERRERREERRRERRR
jgi:hypothetical protein